MPQKTRAASPAKSKAVVKKAKAVKAVKAKPAKAALKAVPAPKAAKAQPVAKEIAKAKQALKTVAPAVPAAPTATPAAVAPTPPAPKATKARSRKISVAVNASEAASALAQKWNSLFKKAEQIESKPYNMKGVFEEKTAIVHKVLGWGYILANRNDRLEVLFKDGIKYLISNYKA